MKLRNSVEVKVRREVGFEVLGVGWGGVEGLGMEWAFSAPGFEDSRCQILTRCWCEADVERASAARVAAPLSEPLLTL